MKIVVLIGAPASGKTSLFRKLIPNLQMTKSFQFGKLKGHINPEKRIGVLGVYDGKGTFEGTDRLSMAVQPDAEKFLESKFLTENFDVIFYEGDRLGNKSFLSKAKSVGHEVIVYVLEAQKSTLKTRHIQRGDSQSEIWLKGREAKVRGVAEEFQAKPLINEQPSDLETHLRTLLLESR